MFRGGLIGLLILIGDVYALINILQSNTDTGNKVIWVLVVWLLPVLGLILWLLFGPRSHRAI